MMFNIWIFIISLTISLFSLNSSLLWAEEKVKLEEVVVTATRTEEEIVKIPANVTVITQEEIKKSTATTVQDLLKNEEGINVRDLFGTGAKSNIDMRGFTYGMHTAVLIDGKKVNEIDLSGVDWNFIPIEKIDRIEIVRGSGSVLYGNNAMAGVINIITKKGTSPNIEVEADGRLESYSGHREYVSLSGASEKIGYYLLAKNRYTEGYRQNGKFDAQDVNTTLSWNVTNSLSVDIRAGYHTDLQGLPGTLNKAEMKSNRRQSVEPNNNMEYEQYFIGADIIYAKDWGEVEAGYHFNNREYIGNYYGISWFGNPYSYISGRDSHMSDYKLKIVLKKKIGDFKNTLVAGVDYQIASASEDAVYGEGSFSSTTVTKIKKQDTGLYFEDELFLNDKISVIAGYRHTEGRDDYEQVSALRGNMKYRGSAYRAGIAYNYVLGAKAYANYSRGFRFPAIEELVTFDFSIPGLTIVPLHPERADTYEVGIVHPFSNAIIGRLSLYHMDVKDEIFYNSSLAINENIKKTRHQGVEAGLTVKPSKNLSCFANWTYSKMTNESGSFKGNVLPLRPKYMANLGTDINFLNNAMLEVKANWVGEQYIENDLDNSRAKLADYVTVDTKLSYKHKSVTVYIGINNLFDKKYSSSAGLNFSGERRYYPAPERNFYGGVRVVL